MIVKQALEKTKCGGCMGGRHPDYCKCNDFDYALVTAWATKYPFGSIDLAAELGGGLVEPDNLRYHEFLLDLYMDVEEWMKLNAKL